MQNYSEIISKAEGLKMAFEAVIRQVGDNDPVIEAGYDMSPGEMKRVERRLTASERKEFYRYRRGMLGKLEAIHGCKVRLYITLWDAWIEGIDSDVVCHVGNVRSKI